MMDERSVNVTIVSKMAKGSLSDPSQVRSNVSLSRNVAFLCYLDSPPVLYLSPSHASSAQTSTLES
jgi:hypothetical protein